MGTSSINVRAAMTFPRTNGQTLERLVMSDQAMPACPVVLTQVPQAAKRIRKGEVIAVRGPCDFFGSFKRVGTAIVFDAKECVRQSSFDSGPTKVKPHQVAQLIRYGRAGAFAGLMVLNTKTRAVHWCDSGVLLDSEERQRSSVGWDEMPVVGSTASGIDWLKVVQAASV